MNSITEPSRSVPVRHKVNVLVIGGGAAGMAAAVSAASAGAEVLLAERYGFLGGTLSAVTLGSICGLYTLSDGQVVQLVHGFADDLIDRLRQSDGARSPQVWLQTASLPYDPEKLKRVADDLVSEAGVMVRLHTLAVAVVEENRRLLGVIFEGPGGRWACLADTVIDCSGNGDIAALMGLEWECDPRELQFPTTMMRFGGVRTDTLAELSRARLHACLEEAVNAGFPLPRTAGGIFSITPGIAHLNITRIAEGERSPDPLSTEELSRAEMNGRRMVGLYVEAFRGFVPGFEDCFLLDTGAQIGVRESRRVKGEYVLEAEDVLAGRRFTDVIACCAWPIEEHGADRATRWVWLPDGIYYQIPFRCLLPKSVDGLLVAGRCASATHDAHASMRVAGTCMAMGQAAGVAAAIAGANGCVVRDVTIEAIHRLLLAQDAFLGDQVQEAGSREDPRGTADGQA